MNNLQHDGFCLVPDAVSSADVERLLQEIESATQQKSQNVHRRENVYAIRNVFDVVPFAREFAQSQTIRRLVEPYLGESCFPVRAILFDKVAGANWKVPWHQDLSIAVKERKDVEGFGPWSEKDGVLHVQPPTHLLEQMLTLRFHLDDCFEKNGPLRVLATSHRNGKLDANSIAQMRSSIAETVCVLPKGGALLMRPLLLHASSSAVSPQHRRVLHLEWAAQLLPDGLLWHECIES